MSSIKKICPVVWTIAGSDSGAGAGIQADLRAFEMLGVCGCSIVTAITAQNPNEILGVEFISESMISAQLMALRSAFRPAAVKIGMLGTASAVGLIANAVKTLETFVVCDPVMIATSGKVLLDEEGIDRLKHQLIPLVDILTPNVPEAEKLVARELHTLDSIETAAHELLQLGAKNVVIKGGHFLSDLSSDYWTNGTEKAWFHSPRRSNLIAHGTGCLFSSTLAAARARGYSPLDAVCLAKAVVNRSIRLRHRVAGGSLALFQSPWPTSAASDDLPWITEHATQSIPESFPQCGSSALGFYPIVDRAEWLKMLLAEGVTTIQLRIKDLTGHALETEIQSAAHLVRQSGNHCRLFVNDYWELAARYGAFGVHLGQDDLRKVDIATLRKTGLRLGISTHTYGEVARAHAARPSYIAIGPIYPTTTKRMPFTPQGIDGIRLWRQLLDYPLVAIGGISLERAKMVRLAGADGMAVITDITRSEHPRARVHSWMHQ